MIKEGRKMNFNNKKTRRIVSIVVLIVIIAMVARQKCRNDIR